MGSGVLSWGVVVRRGRRVSPDDVDRRSAQQFFRRTVRRLETSRAQSDDGHTALTVDTRAAGEHSLTVTDPTTGASVITETARDTCREWVQVGLERQGAYVVAARRYSDSPIGASALTVSILAAEQQRIPARRGPRRRPGEKFRLSSGLVGAAG